MISDTQDKISKEKFFTINFLYKIKLEFGFSLYLIGSLNEIGNWKISKAIKMNCFQENTWQISINFNNTDFENLEYKYFISSYELNTKNIYWIQINKNLFGNHKLNKKEIISANLNKIENTFRIMSFNILYDNEIYGNNLNWENRKENVIEIIKENKCDVIALQEVLKHQVDFIKENLENVYHYYGLGRNKDFSGEQCGILINKFRYDLINNGTFWLSFFPDIPGSNNFKTLFPRIATWVYLREIESYDQEINFSKIFTKENPFEKDKEKDNDNDNDNDINNENIFNYHNENFKDFIKKEKIILNTHYDHIEENVRINSTFIILKKVEEMIKIIYLENLKNFIEYKKFNNLLQLIKEDREDEYINQDRKNEINFLIKKLKNRKIFLLKKIELLVFICGDFNADDNFKEIKLFKKNEFKSLSDLTGNSENTFHGYSGKAFSKIDHIFLRVFEIDEDFFSKKNFFFYEDDIKNYNQIRRERICSESTDNLKTCVKIKGIKEVNYEILRTKKNDIFPSDHFPIVGEIKYE